MLALLVGAPIPRTWARELKVTIPGRSELTPVQRLNREGVNAIGQHQYEKAEAIFYKAYLYDPADPFTLNNLGYVAELQGELERAHRFYALASEQGSSALIDISSAKPLVGKPMSDALTGLQDVPIRVNRMNVEAIELLSQKRNFDADDLLRRALALEPMNPFTLNNLAVAEESTGDFDSALKNYDAAAAFHSSEPIVVTLKHSWRGKPVSEMAAKSARDLRKKMLSVRTDEARVTMLSLRGVTAVNRNDWPAARQNFLEAYSLNPDSAFSLNNLGYVAERDGDMETAEFYYSKARTAQDAHERIGLATQQSAEGQPLIAVATDSGHNVESELVQYSQSRRQQTGPIELIPRDNTVPDNTVPGSAPQPARSSPAAPPQSPQ